MRARMFRVLIVLICLSVMMTDMVRARIADHVTVTHINPLYAGVVAEDDLIQPAVTAASDGQEYFSSTDDASQYLRQQLKARTENVFVYLTTRGDYQNLITDLFEMALEHTGDGSEGDYLRWQYAGWVAGMSVVPSGDTSYVCISYVVTYLTTAEQEEEMDKAVSALLEELCPPNTSDYKKVTAIYHWVCSHVSYDDSGEDRKYTAYSALIEGKAVCQGYALLVYRLLNGAGVDCRIVAGENHGWNIVKLRSLYYNLDATWDSQATGEYQWFLKGQDGFSAGHERDDAFDSEQFHSDHPMSDADYAPGLSGDVNGDGLVDSDDATLILKFDVGLIGDNDLDLSVGDVNGDGWIDSDDATLILKYDVGLIEGF